MEQITVETVMDGMIFTGLELGLIAIEVESAPQIQIMSDADYFYPFKFKQITRRPRKDKYVIFELLEWDGK